MNYFLQSLVLLTVISGDPLPCENFRELRKFAPSYICRFATTY